MRPRLDSPRCPGQRPAPRGSSPRATADATRSRSNLLCLIKSEVSRRAKAVTTVGSRPWQERGKMANGPRSGRAVCHHLRRLSSDRPIPSQGRRCLEIDLGSLELAAVIDVHGLQLREEVDADRSRLAVPIAGLPGAAERGLDL